jgi:hypothetical protein
MPIYTFENTETGEVFDKMMKIAEREQFLKDNPNLKQCLSAPNFVGGTGDRTKPPDGFKDVLQKIADKAPGSKLAQDYGRKDPTTVRTRRAIEKTKKRLGMD